MYSIGISLENEGIQVAVLKENKRQIEVESLHRFPLTPENVKRFYNLSPFHEKASVKISSALPSEVVFIRKILLPLAKEADILKALPFQLESLLPFSPDRKPVVCVHTEPLEKELSAVWVFATSEEFLQEHLSELNLRAIQLDALSCSPTALMRLARWQFQEEPRILAFDVRGKSVCCTLLEKEHILLAQTLPYEGNSSVFEQFLLFLKQKGVCDEPVPWMLSGDERAAEWIQAVFPQKRLVFTDPRYADFALSIGSGLDALALDAFRVDFCQQTLTQPLTWLRKKKQLLLSSSGCVVAAALVFLFGSMILSKKEKALKEALASHLPSIVNCNSREAIAEALVSWEGSFKEKKTPFSLFPNVPKASDVLSYLSTHPAFLNDSGLLKEGVEIQSVHYMLVKYPKIGDPSSPYVARVELTFSSKTPAIAREFHDALLKGDELVNSKRGIEWKSEGSIYRTSFELRKGVSS
jgi:type IV pilus assembly protein PilM